MKRPVVMFDIDGVLCDFVLGFTRKAHETYLHVPATKTYDQPSWNGFPGMTAEEIDATWDAVNQDEHFWAWLPSLISTQTWNAVEDLWSYADVYFVTSRSGGRVLEQTKYWLTRYGVHVPNVVLCKRKGEFAAAIDADYMIDDKAGNALYAAYHAPKVQSYIIDRPYNQFDHNITGSRIVRVKTVEQYLEAIRERR